MASENRERRLHEKSIGAYVRRGRGAIFLTTAAPHGANPLELVLQVAATMPEAFQPWLDRLRALSTDSIHSIIERVPEILMDSTAKQFAMALVKLTRTQLCNL